MNILIAGSGKSLFYLGKTFISKGIHVTIVDPIEAECIDLSRRLRAVVVQGDCSNTTVLEDAGCASADIVVAATPHDELNLAICQTARTTFRVPRTLAIVNNPENEELFEKLNVVAFSATRMFAKLIEERTLVDEVVSMLPIAEGKVTVSEIKLEPDSPAAGRNLIELKLPTGSLLACVLRGGTAIIPRGDTRLETGDTVLLLTLPGSYSDALNHFISSEA